MVHNGTQARLARGKLRCALGDALFERGIELPDFVGGMLALRDVGDRADVVEHSPGAFIAHRNAVRQTPPRSAVTISLDYYGDSVINSVADMLAMMVGFWLARVLPVWVSVLLFVLAETVTFFVIRDGLLLNVLMLVWPLEIVRDWQAAG